MKNRVQAGGRRGKPLWVCPEEFSGRTQASTPSRHVIHIQSASGDSMEKEDTPHSLQLADKGEKNKKPLDGIIPFKGLR